MKTSIFKKSVLLILLLFSIGFCFGQFNTVVDVGSIDNKSLKAKIDGNVSKLLTAINQAFFDKTVPTLAGVEMSNEAKSNIFALWETSPFLSLEDEIYKDILNLNCGGMELRGIKLNIANADSADRLQEGVVVFTKTGSIDDFYFSIGNHIVDGVMKEGKDITDLRRRETILNFVENFRTSYNRKDIDFLKKIFSDDALIITGKVIKEKVSDGNSVMQSLPQERIIYVKQSKSEYMTKMQQIFAANAYLNIKFDELKVVRHGKYPDYYGVTIKQYWNSSKYSDVGYVFLLIDFRDEDNPIIHVRTWQPDKVNGRELAKSEIFNTGSFKL